MNRTRRRRAGFTLTEILMAVGILGGGLSMVASVFPVALDQSRRSRDNTMAALSARSVAAIMRARREDVVRWCRDNAFSTTREMTSGAIPTVLKAYNPDQFLYETGGTGQGATAKAVREYNTQVEDFGLWSAGSYVPVLFATPMTRDAGAGPWRVAIVIYRARGQAPDHSFLGGNFSARAWKDRTGLGQGGVGDYIIDWDPTKTTNTRGETYKVDRVLAITGGTQVVPAVGVINKGSRDPDWYAYMQTGLVHCKEPNGTPSMVSLPGALIAYHTIVGD